MSIKTGTAALFNAVFKSNSPLEPSFKESFVARVDFVLYDDHDKERFQKYGGFEAIGTIECRAVINNTIQNGPPIVARPMDANHRRFPVVNELVRIIPATSYHAQNAKSNYKISYYYAEIIAAFDSAEHNAVPDHSYFQDGENNTSRTVQNATPGVPASANPGAKPVTGERFSETGTVRKLMHSPGDMTVEGRFGNSIRLGGSNTTMKHSPWKGDDNKPLVVIRNGQKISTGENWLPTFEDVNGDGSSLYMLSGHTIPFVPAHDNFESYHHRPKAIRDIVEPILNSPSSLDKSANDADKIDQPEESHQYETKSTGKKEGLSEDEFMFLPDNEDEFNKELEDPLTKEIVKEIGNDPVKKPESNEPIALRIFNAAVSAGAPETVAKIMVGQSKYESGNYTGRAYKATNNAFSYGFVQPHGSKLQVGSYAVADDVKVMGKYNSVENNTVEVVGWWRRRMVEHRFAWSDISTPTGYVSRLKQYGYFTENTGNYLAAIQKLTK